MNDEVLDIDVMDLIALLSFIVGLKNYDENVSQSTMNKAVKSAVNDIHRHLTEQDKKIDCIMKFMEVNVNDSRRNIF